MRMITKAGIAIMAIAAVVAAGAPSASADTTCVWMYYYAGACVDRNTDDPSVQVTCWALESVWCTLPRLP